MNLRTTLVLIALAVVGGMVWWVGPKLPPALDPRPAEEPAPDRGTISVLEKEFVLDNVKGVEVRRGDVTLLAFEKKGDGWVMPGGWRVRDAEVNALVNRLSSLR